MEIYYKSERVLTEIDVKTIMKSIEHCCKAVKIIPSEGKAAVPHRSAGYPHGWKIIKGKGKTVWFVVQLKY